MAVVAGVSIVLIGPPGAGKSTIAHALCQLMPCEVISTGALLRREIATGSVLGKHIAAMINNGNLVSDDVMHQVLGGYLTTLPSDHNVILDGYPRTMSQAAHLPTFLAHFGRALTYVALLDVPDDVSVQLLSGRRTCKTATDSFPVHVDDAASLAECVARGGRLEMRDDDAPDVVRHRVQVYHETTAPLIAFFMQQQLLKRIDARGQPAEIAQALLGLIRGL